MPRRAPHKSTTAGFIGNINVKGNTRCNFAAVLSTRTELYRQDCLILGRICTWNVIAVSLPGPQTTANLITPASSSCAWDDGWYRGTSWHVVTIYNQTVQRPTWSPHDARIPCP